MHVYNCNLKKNIYFKLFIWGNNIPEQIRAQPKFNFI